jgi:hypothetical protein
MSGKQRPPSRKELYKFMVRESRPYRFEYVADIQPLRVNVRDKIIYVNERVLMNVVEGLVKAGLDWRAVMRKSLKHEKAHEKLFKWNLKWGVGAEEYGWLASYLTDVVIDKIYFAGDAEYQRWLIADCRYAFETMRRDLAKLFPTVSSRPHFLYNQAAYWVAVGAVKLEEVLELYPERAEYIKQMASIFSRIKREEDLEWAFQEARKTYLQEFQPP